MLDCNRVVDDSVNDLRWVDGTLLIVRCCVRSVLCLDVLPYISPIKYAAAELEGLTPSPYTKYTTNYLCCQPLH